MLAQLVLISTIVVCGAFAADDVTAELQLTHWPPSPSWPLPKANRSAFLDSLANTAGADRDLFKALLIVFDVGIVVMKSNVTNVTSLCNTFQNRFDQNETSIRQFAADFDISMAVCTMKPVVVPTYAYNMSDDTTIVFDILGGVAVALIIAQIAFGFYHFKSFDFVTLKDEE